jgi:hypothetical protein
MNKKLDLIEGIYFNFVVFRMYEILMKPCVTHTAKKIKNSVWLHVLSMDPLALNNDFCTLSR